MQPGLFSREEKSRDVSPLRPDKKTKNGWRVTDWTLPAPMIQRKKREIRRENRTGPVSRLQRESCAEKNNNEKQKSRHETNNSGPPVS